MRTIRFNAWLPELQYMLEDVAIGHGSIGFPFIDEPEDDFYQFLKSKGFITKDEENLPDYIYAHEEDWCSITEEKHFELLQFTGLKDKNGKDVYEGDVVNCWWMHHEHRLDPPFKAKIIYNSNIANFQISYPNMNGHFVSDQIYFRYQIEVIGNIYQNSELVKIINT
jgi:uncharacterized phage protein (TIGR01671 family)